jgi:hypothetical protein
MTKIRDRLVQLAYSLFKTLVQLIELLVSWLKGTAKEDSTTPDYVRFGPWRDSSGRYVFDQV